MREEFEKILDLIAQETKEKKLVTLHLRGGGTIEGRLLSATHVTRLYLENKYFYIDTNEIIGIESAQEYKQ